MWNTPRLLPLLDAHSTVHYALPGCLAVRPCLQTRLPHLQEPFFLLLKKDKVVRSLSLSLLGLPVCLATTRLFCCSLSLSETLSSYKALVKGERIKKRPPRMERVPFYRKSSGGCNLDWTASKKEENGTACGCLLSPFSPSKCI